MAPNRHVSAAQRIVRHRDNVLVERAPQAAPCFMRGAVFYSYTGNLSRCR
ncbi:hypothetical protein HMPREF3190_00076 [Umbribacter vaginalis]|nr:hypothetical protein HMPREF3190_00076 [Coriobacteriales bacterium DNF00809]